MLNFVGQILWVKFWKFFFRQFPALIWITGRPQSINVHRMRAEPVWPCLSLVDIIVACEHICNGHYQIWLFDILFVWTVKKCLFILDSKTFSYWWKRALSETVRNAVRYHSWSLSRWVRINYEAELNSRVVLNVIFTHPRTGVNQNWYQNWFCLLENDS